MNYESGDDCVNVPDVPEASEPQSPWPLLTETTYVNPSFGSQGSAFFMFRLEKTEISPMPLEMSESATENEFPGRVPSSFSLRACDKIFPCASWYAAEVC